MFKKPNNAVPALVTAFDYEGSYSPAVQQELVERLNAQGADGYFVAGTSGECYHLSLSEKRTLCQDVAERADGREIVLHASCADPRETRALMQEAASLGASAVALGAPPYFAYDENQLFEYLDTLKELTDLPVFYYYIPSLVGPRLSHQFLERALDAGIIQGVKYSDTDLLTMARLMATPSASNIFVGSDDLILGGCAMGAVGAVGSGFNFTLPLVKAMLESLDSGDMARARRIQQRICDISTLMEGREFITFIKTILRHQGFEVGEPRAPIRTAPPETAIVEQTISLINDPI
ncbi:hypothetical protein BSZ39_10130 [Bowdeniella nasicola]|uniref:N-acetylneuraminate lyase n=1 Tax=Bowdeniella nasicola TaxID=208480 RepID=A0A1Q5Q0P3_9ACTO|nr:dihydrodipicolinate synthase family protein [Bowdeniella nasicola]OKL53326.1 hypothetical protein BSZ39_10130 [Bowdeniella nasicola]